MLSKARSPFAYASLAVALALSACKVDFKDGVFACTTSSECPSGLRCDPVAKYCTRQPRSADASDSSENPDASSSHSSTGAVSKPPTNAGQAGSLPEERADAAPARTDAGIIEKVGRDAGPAPAHAADAAHADIDAGTTTSGPMQPTRHEAGAGGSGNTAGARAEQAGAAAQGGAAGSATAPTDCPQGTYCYGFEPGVLDPSGALWPSPSSGGGDLPPNGELTTTTYPASSQNKVLVSRPSAKDGWPKATVGFTGPTAPFSKLVVSFDYVAGDKLVDANPRVILFRFVGVPERNGDSVNVGLLHHDTMLEVQMNGTAPLTTIGPATAPGTLTHVVATFTRKPAACTAEVVYGSLPLAAAAFPCDVERWHLEFGLDMLETQGDQYTQDYVAFFDNLRVSSTP